MDSGTLLSRLMDVRRTSEALIEPLEAEDLCLQRLADVLADLHEAPWTLQPNGSCAVISLSFGGGAFGLLPVDAGGRLQGLTAEGIEQIHQHQLLMLLFVLKAKFHEFQPRRIAVVLEQVFHGLVHLVPPSDHLCHGWPAE